jgi:hypothetical protein
MHVLTVFAVRQDLGIFSSRSRDHLLLEEDPSACPRQVGGRNQVGALFV